MKLGKRRWEAKLEGEAEGASATPSVEPVPQSWSLTAAPEAASAASVAPPVDEPATVVEGEAVELPMTDSPSMPFPVAEEPVLVYTSTGSETPAVTPLAEAGESYASGHAPGTSPSWPEPVVALAAERPEAVVGAAFAGGLLLAMILRRLAH